jgi:hypothetical protein
LLNCSRGYDARSAQCTHCEGIISITFLTSRKGYFLSVGGEGEFSFLAGPKAPEIYTFFTFRIKDLPLPREIFIFF